MVDAKTCLLTLFVMGTSIALCNAGEPAGPFVETLQSTHTCVGISVSSWTATAVTSPTPLISAAQGKWRFVSVQDLDSNNNVDCNENANVSTQTLTSALLTLHGQVVAKGSPGATIKWDLAPGSTWYCMSESITSTSPVVACMGR